MATTNYNLPTITGNMTADVVRDMNALAVATDEAIKEAVDGVDLSTVTQQIGDVDQRVTTHLAEDDEHNRFVDGTTKYKYKFKPNSAKDGLIFVYEEVL